MRQTILGVLAFLQLTLLLPPIWDRIMTSAPDWAWRWLTVGFVVTTTAWVLMSDFVYPRLSQPRVYPISSTVVVALAACVVGGGLWLAFVAYSALPLWHVVKVQPDQFTLHTGDWAGTTQLVVRNTSSESLYQVVLQFTSETEGAIGAADWQVIHRDDDVSVQAGTVTMRTGVTAVRFAAKDAKGQSQDVLQIQFQQLHPGEPRKLTLRGIKPVPSQARVEVIYAQSTPLPLLASVRPGAPLPAGQQGILLDHKAIEEAAQRQLDVMEGKVRETEEQMGAFFPAGFAVFEVSKANQVTLFENTLDEAKFKIGWGHVTLNLTDTYVIACPLIGFQGQTEAPLYTVSGDVAKQLAFLQGAPLPPILVGTIRSPDGTEFDIGFVPLAFRPDSIVAVVGLKPHK